jgi:hypothetical protein
MNSCPIFLNLRIHKKVVLKELFLFISAIIIFYFFSEIIIPGFLISLINFNLIIIAWMILFFSLVFSK